MHPFCTISFHVFISLRSFSGGQSKHYWALSICLFIFILFQLFIFIFTFIRWCFLLMLSKYSGKLSCEVLVSVLEFSYSLLYFEHMNQPLCPLLYISLQQTVFIFRWFFFCVWPSVWLSKWSRNWNDWIPLF